MRKRRLMRLAITGQKSGDMMKIRQGNDFIYLWAIERMGELEDLTQAIDIKLQARVLNATKDIAFDIVNNNIIRIEVTDEWAHDIGQYRLIITYTLTDDSVADKDRKCAVDIEAFRIVSRSADADLIEEISSTSDVAIGLMGKSFTSDDFTEDEWAYLQQPALDAASIALQKGADAESKGNAAAQQGDIAFQKGLTAESQGNTAQNQGNTAEQKGNYAEEQGDYAKQQGDIAETFINNWIKNW